MKKVKPKKYLGQHFLNDKIIAEQIVNSINIDNFNELIEIGPGMGVLTEFLLKKNIKTSYVEIDKEAVDYLIEHFPNISDKLISADFLKIDIETDFNGKLGIIGNFPYNISSQILFKVYHHKDKVNELVGMFQKEVADRVVSKPGNKVYGILSVLLQAYYNIETLLILEPENFTPPPKVKSSVIRLVRNNKVKIDCDEKLFFRIIKLSFNQRRKVIRNSLKSMVDTDSLNSEFLRKRPEQLSVDEFIKLTNQVSEII
ncbi:MAG: 16S rRNA (adenine(1518)-N(6)/adenine(1519)-N(6))-dimethyltransferase RsmA [Bacteroidales bacterium]|nr:16S rRNA (adenine(1518)-N(6)/adenine(1519)-N(6))-dimethyltransferase RsmA [Bacteroidales bacterium]MBN2758116.1 16S rRNA (adenine(1518)-N(6)/adenine(1519)-N(6))-dimethyltransferase RsmA [Bacteroidales bacterium]